LAADIDPLMAAFNASHAPMKGGCPSDQATLLQEPHTIRRNRNAFWRFTCTDQPATYLCVVDCRVDAIRLEERARRGSPSSKAASGGYLRVLTGTHNLPFNDRICTDSIRYIWLMAHFELEWANRHGRTKVGDMLKTERAAHHLSNCARALRACSDGYTKRYSRFQQVLLAEHGSPEQAASIAARRNDPERRTMLLEVRGKRRGGFKALFAAIRSYKRARSAFADA
jgi:hypothetical protein